MATKECLICIGTLRVSGTGEVKVQPDTAWIHLGISTHGKSGQQAFSENAERLTSVTNRLRELGIPDEDLQTSGPSVSPILHYEGKISGYAAENYLTVRASIDQAAKLFDEAIAAGANQSSSISFGLADESAARKAALELAVQAAHGEAQTLAKATSVRLGEPHSIESLGTSGRIILTREAKSTSTPVFQGMITIAAQVNIVYESLHKGSSQEQSR